ncbi:hypothetical protein AJ79_02448 [Helicocarpus griseus UAMH5409]|uniref:Something about silencing protein 4 domain-containing protein n=1 Tax=Helicocarpus griseus UAMH5409 TaxID=1447875 RepID=A0A2B7Y347_9EURO|nr:hypothetical protein AJ79_02448 [Helicocarpus griseus UAMH5409]
MPLTILPVPGEPPAPVQLIANQKGHDRPGTNLHLAMVARSAPTLRFSSVRHRDQSSSSSSSSPSSDPPSKIPSLTTTTTTNTRRHQFQSPLKQTKLPFAPRLQDPSPPQPQPQPLPATIPANDRPLKRAKLDGRHPLHHNDQPSPSTTTANPRTKIPLRNRDSQGLLTTAELGAASRTRSSTTTNNNNNNTTPRPPHLPASTSAVSRTTRQSAHGHLNSSRPPVAVSEDVEKKASGLNAGDNRGDGDNGQKNEGTSPTTTTGREKRSLRSNDGGSRSKSELAMYFQNYEQILSLEPVKPEFLSADTAVLLIDDLTQPVVLGPEPANLSTVKARGKQDQRSTTNGYTVQYGMENPLLELHNAEILDLPSPKNFNGKSSGDPLDDDVYFKAHRRIERQEKQLRNIERERAQHEKVQLDRLLDELQGHDWLRVMGISGITETEKKLYEPKRAYFIKEVSALIEKFRAWKEEEKRRRIERDQSLAEEDEEEDEDEDEEDEEDEEEAVDQSVKEEDTSPQPNGKQDPSFPNFQTYGEPPDINDVDAWAARQLHQEAISASSNPSRHNLLPPSHISSPSSSSHPHDSDQVPRAPSPATTHTSTSAAPAPPPPSEPEPEPEEPFTSFYAKRHLRDAAVGKNRRGRTGTAFGQPLPEVAEREFELPRDILTDEAIGACQRKKRRLRRETRS